MFLKRVEKLVAERPVLLAFCVLLAAVAIVVPVSVPFLLADRSGFVMNVVAEAHGTLFDLLLIGWLLLWLNKLADWRHRENRCREEIEDLSRGRTGRSRANSGDRRYRMAVGSLPLPGRVPSSLRGVVDCLRQHGAAALSARASAVRLPNGVARH